MSHFLKVRITWPPSLLYVFKPRNRLYENSHDACCVICVPKKGWPKKIKDDVPFRSCTDGGQVGGFEGLPVQGTWERV